MSSGNVLGTVCIVCNEDVDDNDLDDLVVLEGPLKVAPVTPSEDHVRRPAEYLHRDYRDDHDDDCDDFD